jgi:integrase
MLCKLLKEANKAISSNIPRKSLTSEPSLMEPKKRRKAKGTVVIGRAAATVRIYPITRKDGYLQNTLCWKEGGRRRTRCFACMDEAKMVAQQISVRLTNGWSLGDEVTRRDIEILRHCETIVRPLGVGLVAAVEEWVSARKTAGPIPLADAVRFYQTNRTDLFPSRSVEEVAEEFVTSLRNRGVSVTYACSAKLHLKGFTEKLGGEISDVTVADINRYLSERKTLGAVSKNGIRRNIITMFGFAKKQGYLHPDRKTAAEQSEKFKEQEAEIQIFTPEEMGRILLAAHARILPFLAIGAFAGIRSAEIHRLHWDDIKWDRDHIEIMGKKAKTAARRLVPLTDNLKAWLAPWREATGPIVPISDMSGSLGDVAVKAQIPGGWRQNALRHSFISYRVSMTGDVARTSLEAGNSPKMIFRHYREVVTGEEAKEWFAIMPPEIWPPQDWRLRVPTRVLPK